MHILELAKICLMTESDQTGEPCIAAIADLPVKNQYPTLWHISKFVLLLFFVYGWCYVFSGSFSPACTHRLNNVVMTSMQLYDIRRQNASYHSIDGLRTSFRHSVPVKNCVFIIFNDR